MAQTKDQVRHGTKSPGRAQAARADAEDAGSDTPRENKSLAEAATTIADRAEAVAAERAETAVSGRGFATVLGWVAENVIAVTRIGSDVADAAIRNLRLAGRQDLARIGIQQARTEDKLERLLAEVEKLEAELRRARTSGSGSTK